MWSSGHLAEIVIQQLMQAEAQLVREQAYRGLDALDEVDLHPIIADGFRAEGLGVLREQPYPSEWARKLGRRARSHTDLPADSDRQRCDLVITQQPGLHLTDLLTQAKEHQRIKEQMQGTLFLEFALQDTPLREEQAAGVDEVFWLEIKCVGQFAFIDGVPTPNGQYASQLTRGVKLDLAKLSSDAHVLHGGVLLLHFTQDEPTWRHDSQVLLERLIEAKLLPSSPSRGGFPISDRIGNAWCGVMLFEAERSGK
jgi:hypothetical protein